MSPTVVIEGVSKRFRRSSDQPKTVRDRFIQGFHRSSAGFSALEDINLEINAGETIGLLGHNGSGKSTLLKCIAGTLRPTTGSIRVEGRLAALLELGAGFHPDLTGRENVYLNGSILGFSRRDLDRIFADIVEFAELEDFIDEQVKHYSSGMYARLGFAVAVNVDPDVLLVDEVLAVGDERFQRKCLDRVRLFQTEGRTIFVVTHSADMVRQLCDRAAVLDHGRQIFDGSTAEAVRVFRGALEGTEDELPSQPRIEVAIGETKLDLVGVEVQLPDHLRDHLYTGEALGIHLFYTCEGPSIELIARLKIFDLNETLIVDVTNTDLGVQIDDLGTGGQISFVIEHVTLLDGRYRIELTLRSPHDEDEFHRVTPDPVFDVVSDYSAAGIVALPMYAAVKKNDPT